jgi:uncharacterized protein YqjF (DUF2071 family)
MIPWNSLTDHNSHRPWPLAPAPWVMTMSWRDLLFAHWTVAPEKLRTFLPEDLELDTFDGRAYLGVVPFRMAGVGPRGLGWVPPELTSPRAFPELNVRTYVRHGDRPGVWFFSLDASSRFAVWGARTFFSLPYFQAAMTTRAEGGWIEYASRRRDPRLGPGDFVGRYRGVGEVYLATPGTLEHWLTERYCLYAADERGRLHRGEIHHLPWPLTAAEAVLETNTVADAHGLLLDGEPELLHFVRELNVVAWWPDVLST